MIRCDLNKNLKLGWEKAIWIFGDEVGRSFQAAEDASAKAFTWEDKRCVLGQAKKPVFLEHCGRGKTE